MTFLILEDDLARGEALSAQISAWEEETLCLVMRPEEAEDTLRQIQVECVVGAPELASQFPKRRFVSRPTDAVTEPWLQALFAPT